MLHTFEKAVAAELARRTTPGSDGVAAYHARLLHANEASRPLSDVAREVRAAADLAASEAA